MPVDLTPPPPFLDLVADNTRKALLAVAQTLTVPKGTMIFRTGDGSDGLYELVSGKVKLSRLPGETPDHPANRHESLLRVVSAGQIFGEVAVFDGGPRNASAVAVTKAVVRRYAQADIERMVRQRPDLAVACLTLITRRLRFALERTTDIHIRDGAERLIKAILLLGARFGQRDGESLVVRHDLTQAEIGALTGLSRETVSKSLAELAGKGLVQISSGKLVITDEDALRRCIGPYT
jgi:CRP-like cAMP-binding protein